MTAGDDPRPREEREIETAEEERRRLEGDHDPRPGHELDHVRRALREHDRDTAKE